MCIRDSLYTSFVAGLGQFIGLSSEHDMRPGSVQHDWLLAQLELAQSRRVQRPWLVVFMHRPLYCSNNIDNPSPTNEDYVDCVGGYAQAFRRRLEPLFESYGVDIVLQAHVHAYERLWPTRGGESVLSYQDPDRPVFVTSGAAGCHEGLESGWPTDPPSWSAYRAAVHGVGVLEIVNSTVLEWQYINATSQQPIDRFTLRRTRPVDTV
eukprot:TRINITY_DN63355_c0_g1_i2.p1 TRINITY_DN63355_c0_g1~~TRINITY_DN63355_c0_g1_i2.p1  ORF type:complete len:208 (+),score=16.34 TRINITY_DN63355_c0_g1_i2:160-783(+)